MKPNSHHLSTYVYILQHTCKTHPEFATLHPLHNQPKIEKCRTLSNQANRLRSNSGNHSFHKKENENWTHHLRVKYQQINHDKRCYKKRKKCKHPLQRPCKPAPIYPIKHKLRCNDLAPLQSESRILAKFTR